MLNYLFHDLEISALIMVIFLFQQLVFLLYLSPHLFCTCESVYLNYLVCGLEIVGSIYIIKIFLLTVIFLL